MVSSMLYHPMIDGGLFPDRWSSNKLAHVRRGYQVSRIMPACEMMPADKKAFVGAVGEDLVKRHGKKRYYRLDEIARSATDRGYPIDVHCWAYCIFSSPDDFRSFHDALGEICDYTKMKAEVLSDLSGGSFEWPDIDLSWLDWPDIDLSSLFDWFDLSP